MVKILGVYYLYNDKLEIQENFKRHIIKIEKNLRIWRMRDLSIVGEIAVFKTLAISKMVHLALVKTIPNWIMQELRKISKEFVWKTRNPKIKHDTFCKNYENGSLKNHDIMYKVVSLRSSCIRLYGNNSHYWKVIPLHMITQKLVKKFLFHSNLDVKIQNKSIIFHNIIRKFSENEQQPIDVAQYPIFNNFTSHLVQ